MNTKKILTLTAFAVLLAAPLAALAQAPTTTPTAPASVNTNAEKAAWEALMSPVGEYAAIASYQAAIDKYGQVEPYVSIIRSEESHASALNRQLQRYGVDVPTNPYLGKVSAPDNLKLAAQDEADVEVANVAMYDRLFALAYGDAQLTRVFNNLRAASQNVHLPLFSLAAEGNGTLTTTQMNDWHIQNGTNNGGFGPRR